MPRGISNGKSQMPNMKPEIGDLKYRALARIQGYTSINAKYPSWCVNIWLRGFQLRFEILISADD